MSKPHCYGKMDWILKYDEDSIPSTSICDCQYKNSCMRFTRNNYEKAYKEVQDYIDKCRYTYKVEDIILEYKTKYRKKYVCYTMNDCITNLEDSLKILSNLESEVK